MSSALEPRRSRRSRISERILLGLRDRRVFRGLLAGIVVLSGLAAAQQAPDRSRPPALAPPPQLDLPSIQKRSLRSGIPVWVIESHEVPIVQVSAIVRAGAANDPAGKFGVASLTAAMLDEGAGSRSALQIADAIEFLGASLSTASSFDASAVRLNVPVQHLDEAMSLMADVVVRPTFPDMELERLRQERLTSLLQARDDPGSVAAMAFPRILFGPMHRYGTATIGTEASVKALAVEDLRAFHAAYYQGANTTLVVVGDITAEAMLPRVEEHFGSWSSPAGARRQTEAPAVPQLDARQTYIIDKPGSEQSQIRIGWIGVPRSTPDYFPLIVMNTILGGSFTSRLNQNLRETHGYSYGASSLFDMRVSAGPFVAAAGVQTDKTAEAIREFFNELTGMRLPVGPEELQKARNYIALGFPAEFESSTDLSRRLEELIVYGLPDDYFERYVPSVLAVTVEDVRRVAERYVQPSRSAVVVVGDRKVIEPGIRALNLGPVRVMSVDEALAP